MKIIVLGGAGDMGSLTVEDLAATAGVDRVTIADYNEGAAERLAERLADAPAEVGVRKVDANDHNQLVDAMAGHEVAASALGPFYKFEPLMVQAAIEAKVPYTSVCDDWSACERVLDEFKESAREAGVIVVTGIGASPGLTNLMVKYLAVDLDRVRRIDVNVYQPWSAGGGEAVLRHLLFIVSGEIAGFREGQPCRIPACSETILVDMPQYGTRKLWNLGHSEPVSLPRYYPGLEQCNFWMGMGRGMELLAAMGRRGWFQKERNVNRVVGLAAPLEKAASRAAPGLSAIRVDVWGDQGGEDVHRSACGTKTMRDGTGLALSVGTLMLAQGAVEVTEGGVYGPESVYEVKAFMDRAREKGLEAYEDTAMTQPILE